MSDRAKRDALVLANARRLIKAHKSTSNGRLCSELFGLGMGTGRQMARSLGLDPDSNETSYNAMCEHINQLTKERVREYGKVLHSI